MWDDGTSFDNFKILIFTIDQVTFTKSLVPLAEEYTFVINDTIRQLPRSTTVNLPMRL